MAELGESISGKAEAAPVGVKAAEELKAVVEKIHQGMRSWLAWMEAV